MFPIHFNSHAIQSISRRTVSIITLIGCCLLMLSPTRCPADTPPYAPAGTQIMVYGPDGVAENVTANFQNGEIDNFYGNPPIPVTFDYSTGDVIDTDTGDVIGYMLYPNQ